MKSKIKPEKWAIIQSFLSGELGDNWKEILESRLMEERVFKDVLALIKPAHSQPRNYTVHYKNKRGGFSILNTVSVTPVHRESSITEGPVLVSGKRKLKCNILDNRSGKWVRVDYNKLSDYWKGLAITYHADGTHTEKPFGKALRRLDEPLA